MYKRGGGGGATLENACKLVAEICGCCANMNDLILLGSLLPSPTPLNGSPSSEHSRNAEDAQVITLACHRIQDLEGNHRTRYCAVHDKRRSPWGGACPFA